MKAQYRIIRKYMAEYGIYYRVEKRFLWIFWTYVKLFTSFEEAERFIAKGCPKEITTVYYDKNAKPLHNTK